MPWRSVTAMLCAALLLVGCGQKGALFFPEAQLAEQQPSTSIHP